jgi:hypothetical protein
MNFATRVLSLMALCCVVATPSMGQSQAAPPAATAQSEAGEPRADTSSPPAAAAAPAIAPAAAATPAPAVSPAPATTAGRSTARAPAPGRAAPASGPGSATKIDRLDLGTATVTGDREQPKVMYIVPWKRSDIGDLAGKPMNSLVDEILAPVDRDVFKREVVYYQAVQADASQNGAQPKPAQQGEK